MNQKQYLKLHKWIRKNWLKPLSCESCGLFRRLDWANKSGKYKEDRNDWIALCRSCHLKMDMTTERKQKISTSNMGKHNHVVSTKTRKWMSEIKKEKIKNGSIIIRNAKGQITGWQHPCRTLKEF